MKPRLTVVSLSFAGCALAFGALAQAPSGEQIARSGGGNGVAPCSSCHGANGEGNPAANFPRLAAQPAYYLTRQLDSFSDGSRENPIMTPIAKALSPEQRTAVSDYYAQLQAPASSPAPARKGAAASDRGRTLALVGDDGRHVQACGNCHGPNGIGEAPTFPFLAGQNATYLTSTLKDWREGRRKSDPSGQMPEIAHQLSDSDITALSTYFASQTPPGPAPASEAAATSRVPSGSGTASTGAASRASGSSASTGGGNGTNAGTAGGQQSSGDTSAARGTGVEQGAPTTGGGQSIGGGGAASGSGPQGSPEGNPSASGGSTTGNPNAQRSVPGDAQTPRSGGGGQDNSKGTAK